jgi:hypothetical protein
MEASTVSDSELRRGSAALTALLLSTGLACGSLTGPYRAEIRGIYIGMSRDKVRDALGEPYGYSGRDELLYYKKGTDTILAVAVDASDFCPRNNNDVCGWMLLEVPSAGLAPAGKFAYYNVKERGGAAANGINAVGIKITPAIFSDVYFGEARRVKSLLESNPALVFLRYNGNETPLFGAVSSGREMTELMLAAKADVNAKDDRGWTPLHEAYNNRDIAALLLAHGAEVNARNKDGQNAFGPG